ncbi:hypothetical protein CDL12_25889 [Handroanthus impetiginosus]|uniref:Uncharacterized protein n=1 Tax=Handroanthus impetiginosus TaxID=429701 RepID=A0A2G9G8J1_9LAMI|nr:hypothetical protein CDL12_25889 [Handroanthus impetiginosus]
MQTSPQPHTQNDPRNKMPSEFENVTLPKYRDEGDVECESDESDPLYKDGEESDNRDDDDLIFQSIVDVDAEWAGIEDEGEGNVVGKGKENIFESEIESSNEKEIVWDSDAILDSDCGSDGIKFQTKEKFRMAIHAEAVQSMRNIKIKRNDKERIYVKCETPNLGYVSSSYLAKRFINKLKYDSKRKTEGFRQDMVEDMGVSVSWHKAYRAKQKIIKMIEGDPKMGCHLSGPHKEVILTTVGIDPNNEPSPVSYVVAEILWKAAYNTTVGEFKKQMMAMA